MEQCNFQQSIECLSRQGVYKTAVWRQKLNEVGEKEGRRILEDLGVMPIALCAAVLLGDTQEVSLSQCIEQNRRILEQAAAIGAPSVIVITGGLDGFGRDIQSARSMSLDVLGSLVPYAKALGIRLVLEPLHPMVCGNRSVISTLGEASQMLKAINVDDVLGIALDTYALWWQADLQTQIEQVGNRVCHFHVSDWLPNTNDIRFDRGMPGDGLIDNRQIRQWLESTGFDGAIEVEIFSKQNWWQRPEDEVISVIKQRYVSSL
ncbi:MAG: TIM barrel protein [Gammaproteobacteria bacterium]|nr:TIM barrel protein [Gammaproteobacteria bacterium]